MCGIAGLIHRDGSGNIGQEMTAMLQSLKHRSPDSTGYAIYGQPGRNEFVMRFKVAEQEDMNKGFDIHDRSRSAAPRSRNGWRPWAFRSSTARTPRHMPTATASIMTAI